ncbi:hypothetical protein [Paenibacillus sp.]|uniref:hypothetical protein n=1 Tax=Paenibacillus sp. TaxID=58172 RepID=UPI002D6A14A5|nr:hypothetical protein [Paenibacillus sp.]HZG88092.1 hypothetical protein [Paenibacillus sp.]
MNRLIRYILPAVVLMMLLPQQVGAYSYGDPSQEAIAEAMKEMIAKLPDSSPDWAAVGEIYKVHRPEIESHFGSSVAATLDADIAAKDKERFLSNYKALLVLNLERRFKYANASVDDYSQSKLLLAKAKGTYDVLAPYVGSDDTHKAVLTAFDEALKALGNPGLFGVGEEPVDPETFKTKTAFILGKLKPLFPMKSAPAQAAPAKSEPAKAEPAKSEPAKSEPAKTEPAKSEPAKTTPAPAPAEPAKAEPAQAEPAAAEPAAAEAEAAGEAAPVEAEAPAESVSAEASAEVEAPVETAEADPAAAGNAAVETAAADEAEVSLAHAPMERASRTNPIVSIVVIGGVALAAGGGLWYAKKRKLF